MVRLEEATEDIAKRFTLECHQEINDFPMLKTTFDFKLKEIYLKNVIQYNKINTNYLDFNKKSILKLMHRWPNTQSMRDIIRHESDIPELKSNHSISWTKRAIVDKAESSLFNHPFFL
ncbi:hypothetical protein TNCT_172851 [Trichonephila clavata]|uniref:Uncharacterized protein n=1 Tax=Trichonephila clavata TaxID=2740835 RepID=A0A8X6HD34_TRICU|nr:hypothetical protein TNCT_172851 [Trichonephila clavata]